MAEPIRHNAASTVATAGWGAAKGGALGLIASFAVGALAVVAVATGVGALGGAIGGMVGLGGGAAAGAGAMLSGFGGAVTLIGAVIGGTMSTGALGIPLAGLGAGVGLVKGGMDVSKDNQKADAAIARAGHAHANQRAQEITNAELRGYMEGMQKGGQIGFQRGAQHVVNELEKQAQAQMQRVDAGHEQVPHTHATKNNWVETHAQGRKGAVTPEMIREQQAAKANAAKEI